VPGPVPRCPAIMRFVHPLTSDKRLYVVSPSGSVPPCTRVRAACPAPGGSPATSSEHPAGRTRFGRRCSSVAPRMATAHRNLRFVSGGQPAIMSHRTAASLKASRKASSAVRRSRRRCRWRAGPGCRATVMAESGY
jgi:hypothetical protein